MCEAEDKFIDNAIYRNRSTNQFQRCISRVVEDEILSIEVCQRTSTYTSSKLHPISDANERKLKASLL